MALKGNFNKAAFEKKVQEKLDAYKQNVIEALRWLGSECVADAKSNGSYTDRTGNLRNSIGYIVFENGNILHENFEETANGTELSDENPTNVGRDLAIQVGSDFPGMALVVVAGMKYAMYVEGNGYTVLTSAELLANNALPRLLKDLR